MCKCHSGTSFSSISEILRCYNKIMGLLIMGKLSMNPFTNFLKLTSTKNNAKASTGAVHFMFRSSPLH